ncbi:MAG TPA: thioredoxin domain-containing protein [Longimicrobiales bacterium]|nr:thioredoxin domain-containing protein [Longimicrobiales bacterium]
MAQHRRKPEEARRDGSNPAFKWILIAVAVLGVVGIGYSIWSAKAGGAATGPVTLDDVDPQAIAEQAQPVRKGSASATVQIVEFADYQCPGCAYFATTVGRPIRAAYVDSGLVQMVYYDYPITSAHPHAFLAARAARCAGDQELYWEMHDMLYARQQEWSLDRTAPVERYTGYAQSIGADADAFEDCLRSERYADVVTANALLGEQLGVRSTPTIFLNGRSVGEAWSDFGRMRQLIDGALADGPRPSGAAPAPVDSPDGQGAVPASPSGP